MYLFFFETEPFANARGTIFTGFEMLSNRLSGPGGVSRVSGFDLDPGFVSLDGFETLLEMGLPTDLGFSLASTFEVFAVEKEFGDPLGVVIGESFRDSFRESFRDAFVDAFRDAFVEAFRDTLETPLDPGGFTGPFFEEMGASVLDLVFMLRERASSSFVMDADIGCTHPSHVLFFGDLNAVDELSSFFL